MLRVGIVGLPNAGKSTLFNALTGTRQADVASYPFCTIEPNVGVIALNDPRLDELGRILGSRKQVPSTIEFVDIAGLVAGAHAGEGLGDRFLGRIREVDAIAHVVRCFDREGVPRTEGSVDPVSDAQTVETELLLADHATVERRQERTARRANAGQKDAVQEMARLARFAGDLGEGVPARAMQLQSGDDELMSQLFLLTAKPVLYVVNTDEARLGKDDDECLQAVTDHAKRSSVDARALVVCGDLEAEVAELDPAEAAEFLHDAGVEERGIDQLVRHAHELLGLITFFTGNEDEVHAWPIRAGTGSVEAAGEVHTDMERGFIRAEVASFADVRDGGVAAARDRGLLRVEGRDYRVQDGDVIMFRFNP